MIIYTLNLICIMMFSALSGDRSEQRAKKIIFALFTMASMIAVYTIRWGVGTDFSTYKDIYWLTSRQSFLQILTTPKETGFHLITWFSNFLRPDDFVFYNFLIGCLVYIPTVYTIRKEAEQFTLSMILYILLNIYTFPFNGMRQGIAIAIAFAGHSLLKEKRYLAYSIIAFLAFEFHYTTLIVLPFFIIAASKTKMETKFIIEAVLLVSVLLLGNLWELIINILDELGQEAYVLDYSNALNSSIGVKPIRVIAALPPVVCAIWRYQNINELRDSRCDYEAYLHMSIFNVIFYIAGMRVITLARFGAYFDIYNCLLLPMICRSFKSSRERKLFTFVMLALYALMWIVLLHVDSEVLPFRLKNGMQFN